MALINNVFIDIIVTLTAKNPNLFYAFQELSKGVYGKQTRTRRKKVVIGEYLSTLNLINLTC